MYSIHVYGSLWKQDMLSRHFLAEDNTPAWSEFLPCKFELTGIDRMEDGIIMVKTQISLGKGKVIWILWTKL